MEANPIITNIIAEILKGAYAKSYRMRSVGPGSLEATIPRVIVEKEARKWGLSVEEFIKVAQVEYVFDDFGGAFLRFKKRPSQGKEEVEGKIREEG